MCLMSQNNLDLSNNQATWLLCNVWYSSYKNNKKKAFNFFLKFKHFEKFQFYMEINKSYTSFIFEKMSSVY